MKTKITTFGLFLLMSATAIVFNGCKGKDGAPGAEGPKGADGNANVTSIVLTATNFYWNGTYQYRYASWSSISILTSAVASTGAVMLYQSDGAGAYIALPISQSIGGDVSEHDYFTYSEGKVSVVIENSDKSDPIANISLPTTYKLVCIPSKAMIAHPNVDIKNYTQVKDVFNLKN
jgi:hypothetical protein